MFYQALDVYIKWMLYIVGVLVRLWNFQERLTTNNVLVSKQMNFHA